MTSDTLLRELAALVPDRSTADRPLAHDEAQQIAAVVARWRRAGCQGSSTADGYWICACQDEPGAAERGEDGANLNQLALDTCELCGLSRPVDTSILPPPPPRHVGGFR